MNNTTLLQFTCSCGHIESIGVGVQVGIVIKGDITIICPKCGRIHVTPNALLINPVARV